MEKTKKRKAGKNVQLDIATRNRRKRYRIAWIMVAPAVILRLCLIGYPFVMTLYNSFFEYKALKPQRSFIGFENYAKLFQDVGVTESIGFTIAFTFITMAMVTVLGVLLALLMNAKFKGRNVVRTVILIPWAVPTIVAAIAFQWAFNDTFGFINDFLSKISGSQVTFPWLATVNGARVAVILVEVWKHTPMFAIMVLAGLQSIPEELYESAKLDGAGKFKTFFTITLPHITKLLLSLITFQLIWRATGFELVYGMTSGGPGSATSLLSYRIFLHSVKNLNWGYSSAIAMVMFAILLIIITVGLSIQRKVGLEGDSK